MRRCSAPCCATRARCTRASARWRPRPRPPASTRHCASRPCSALSSAHPRTCKCIALSFFTHLLVTQCSACRFAVADAVRSVLFILCTVKVFSTSQHQAGGQQAQRASSQRLSSRAGAGCWGCRSPAGGCARRRRAARRRPPRQPRRSWRGCWAARRPPPRRCCGCCCACCWTRRRAAQAGPTRPAAPSAHASRSSASDCLAWRMFAVVQCLCRSSVGGGPGGRQCWACMCA